MLTWETIDALEWASAQVCEKCGDQAPLYDLVVEIVPEDGRPTFYHELWQGSRIWCEAQAIRERMTIMWGQF